jgi:citrate synthase
MHKSHGEVYGLLLVRSFYDKFHLTKNVAERYGKTGKEAFLNAWHATSLEELAEAKRAFTPALDKYLGRFGDHEIYPAACPDLGSRRSQWW